MSLTSVHPADDAEAISNWSLKSAKRVSTSILTEQGKRQVLYADGKIEVASDEECSRKPTDLHGENNIICYVLVKKVRRIDAIASCIDASFIFNLRWTAFHLKNKRVNKDALWKPDLSIINYDELSIEPTEPWFYPETGDVRQIVHVSGTIANEQNLRRFPFDADDIKLLFCVEIGTGDQHARLCWDSFRDVTALTITPDYVVNQLKEWNLHRELNSVRRMPAITSMTGKMTGIEIRMHISRKYTFYLAKISSLLWLMTFSCFYVFSMNEGHDAVIDRGVLNERLNFSAALLLTSVSFLYLSGDSIPKLSYLTFFDWMMIHSFLTQFAVMFEAYIAFTLTQRAVDPFIIQSVDFYSAIGLSVQFVIIQLGLVGYALCYRRKWYYRAKEQKCGVEPCLMKDSARLESEMKGPCWYDEIKS